MVVSPLKNKNKITAKKKDEKQWPIYIQKECPISTSTAIREMQIKTTLRFHLTPTIVTVIMEVRMKVSQKQTNKQTKKLKVNLPHNQLYDSWASLWKTPVSTC